MKLINTIVRITKKIKVKPIGVTSSTYIEFEHSKLVSIFC